MSPQVQMASLIGFCVWLLSALVLWAQPDSSGAQPILSGYIWRSRAPLSNWDGRAGFVANIKAGVEGGGEASLLIQLHLGNGNKQNII